MVEKYRIVYDVLKTRGGYRVYGENGIREYAAKHPTSAIRAYIEQAKTENFVTKFRRKKGRVENAG